MRNLHHNMHTFVVYDFHRYGRMPTRNKIYDKYFDLIQPTLEKILIIGCYTRDNFVIPETEMLHRGQFS